MLLSGKYPLQAQRFDKLYTGQIDIANYKITTPGRHTGGEEVQLHSNLSTG
jgi:hypothetical protein